MTERPEVARLKAEIMRLKEGVYVLTSVIGMLEDGPPSQEISVEGRPPVKQAAADPDEKRRREEAEQLLRERARQALGNRSVEEGGVRLIIVYQRGRGRGDPANIIGGIADSLQGIAYTDDRQLAEIHYYEYRDLEEHEDQYTVWAVGLAEEVMKP